MKHLNDIGFFLALIAIVFLLYAGEDVRKENESLRAKIRQYETRDSINALNVDTILVRYAPYPRDARGADSVLVTDHVWYRTREGK